MVLDAGLPGYRAQLPAALKAMGKTLDDIDAVVLTHYHVDHTGTAAWIQSQAGSRVHVHGDDAEFVRGKRRRHQPRLPLTRPWFLGYLAHLLGNGAAGYPAVADPVTFADGEVLDVPGNPRVIHAPGHTPGSCALHFQERDVLFTGDTLGTLDTGRGVEGPTVMSRMWNMDSEAALESLARLERAPAKTLLPGHGEPWYGGVLEAVKIARVKGLPN